MDFADDVICIDFDEPEIKPQLSQLCGAQQINNIIKDEIICLDDESEITQKKPVIIKNELPNSENIICVDELDDEPLVPKWRHEFSRAQRRRINALMRLGIEREKAFELERQRSSGKLNKPKASTPIKQNLVKNPIKQSQESVVCPTVNKLTIKRKRQEQQAVALKQQQTVSTSISSKKKKIEKFTPAQEKRIKELEQILEHQRRSGLWKGYTNQHYNNNGVAKKTAKFNSKKKVTKKRKPTANNAQQVTITHFMHPSQKLTQAQMQKVKQSILEEVDKAENLTANLGFFSCIMENGCMSLTCNNKESFMWLMQIFYHLEPYPNAKLFIRKVEKQEKTFTCIAFIPAKDVLPTNLMLNRLEKQNVGLNTAEWRITGKSKQTNGDETIIFSVDERSKERIMQQNNKLFLNFSKIKIKVKNHEKNAYSSDEEISIAEYSGSSDSNSNWRIGYDSPNLQHSVASDNNWCWSTGHESTIALCSAPNQNNWMWSTGHESSNAPYSAPNQNNWLWGTGHESYNASYSAPKPNNWI